MTENGVLRVRDIANLLRRFTPTLLAGHVAEVLPAEGMFGEISVPDCHGISVEVAAPHALVEISIWVFFQNLKHHVNHP